MAIYLLVVIVVFIHFQTDDIYCTVYNSVPAIPNYKLQIFDIHCKTKFKRMFSTLITELFILKSLTVSPNHILIIL